MCALNIVMYRRSHDFLKSLEMYRYYEMGNSYLDKVLYSFDKVSHSVQKTCSGRWNQTRFFCSVYTFQIDA